MSLKKEDVLGRGIVGKNKTTEGKEKTREKGGYGGASEPTFWVFCLRRGLCHVEQAGM